MTFDELYGDGRQDNYGAVGHRVRHDYKPDGTCAWCLMRREMAETGYLVPYCMRAPAYKIEAWKKALAASDARAATVHRAIRVGWS